MNKASYYNISVLLASLYILHQTQSFKIFWKFDHKIGGECLRERELIKHMILHPEACFQGPYDAKNKMAIQECVQNIPCNRTSIDVDYANVMKCSSKGQIVCCLDKKKYCQRKKHTNDKSDCKYIGRKRKHHNRHQKYHKGGNCVFPFIYHGKSYYKCTVDGASDCDRWCAIMVNENNVYITGSTLWAYCENKCSVEYGENCKNKTKVPRFQKERKDHETKKPEISCGTQNTTTTITNHDGKTEDFILLNPGNCAFPFNYRGTWHETCITEDDPMCRYWCSVQNDHGYHRALGSKWAYCNTDCPKNDKNCGSSGKHISPHFYEDEFPTLVLVESEDPNFKFEEDD